MAAVSAVSSVIGSPSSNVILRRAVLRELIATLRRIGFDVEVELIFFNDEAVCLNGGTEPKLVRSSPEFIEKMERLLKQNEEWAAGHRLGVSKPTTAVPVEDIVPRGGTFPQAPLLAALRLAPGKIHLLTDGEIQPMFLDLDAVPKDSKTVIDAIEIGPGPAPSKAVQDNRLVAKLARAHGGEYQFVSVEAPAGGP
jgi:hypothetical protein